MPTLRYQLVHKIAEYHRDNNLDEAKPHTLTWAVCEDEYTKELYQTRYDEVRAPHKLGRKTKLLLNDVNSVLNGDDISGQNSSSSSTSYLQELILVNEDGTSLKLF